jgi:hypothetical protein
MRVRCDGSKEVTDVDREFVSFADTPCRVPAPRDEA